MPTTYVIRKHCFGYDDEAYYRCGSRIDSIYDDKQKATEHLNSIHLQYTRDTDLGSEGSIFHGSQEHIKALDDFVFEKTGQHIAVDKDYVDAGTQLPEQLKDEDVLCFAELAGIEVCKLVEFTDESRFYGLWIKDLNDFYRETDEYYEGLYYTESKASDIADIIEILLEEESMDFPVFAGSLEEISHSPAVLQSLIGALKGVKFDEKSLRLSFDNKIKMNDLIAINALLIDPMFEWRELAADKIMELESAIEM